MEFVKRHHWLCFGIGLVLVLLGAFLHSFNATLGFTLEIAGAAMAGAVRVITFTDANEAWHGRRQKRRDDNE